MKKIKLLIGERLSFSNLLMSLYGAGKGGLSLSAVILCQELFKKLSVDDKERKDVDFKSVSNPDGNDTLNWNAEKDKGKEIEFTREETDFMEEAIRVKNEQKAFSLSDVSIVSLAEKLELKL